MAASINDKISLVSDGTQRPNTTTVNGIRTVGQTSLICTDLTGWTEETAVHFVTYRVDGQGKVEAGTQTDFKGVVNGNTISSLVVTGGTDIGNNVGDIVQIMPTAAWARDLGETLHTFDGAWMTWTPSWTNFNTALATLNFARYTQIGKTVHFALQYTLTGAAFSGSARFTVPVPQSQRSQERISFGTVVAHKSYTPGQNAFGTCSYYVSGEIVILFYSVDGSLIGKGPASSIFPFTWGSGDTLAISGTYEAA